MTETNRPGEIIGSATFQSRVLPWLIECFGPQIAGDRAERNHRFYEEATELVQACGMTASEAHQLVDYVYGRPVGERFQEVGGAMVTLAALCLANEINMHAAGEAELARISMPEIVLKIRAKQAAKPKHSPLPVAAPVPSEDAYIARRMTETLAEVAATIIGDDTRPEDGSLNVIECVKKAAQVLRLEVDLYRAQRSLADRAFEIADESMVELLVSHSVRGDALAPTYGLSDAHGREVRELEDADPAIQQAFEWLNARELAELVEGELDTSIVLKGHAVEFVGI